MILEREPIIEPGQENTKEEIESDQQTHFQPLATKRKKSSFTSGSTAKTDYYFYLTPNNFAGSQFFP